ncbi:MAG: hypothetical protein K8L97_17320 [Anaerolineae bacterium]|nr:hypothetical protein [Anaerolineae bacterium]
MLHKHLPFALVHPENPLFKIELRRAHTARSGSQLAQYTLRIAGIMLTGLLLLWGIAVYSAFKEHNASATVYYTRYEIIGASNQILVWLFVVSLGANLLLDMRCMTSGLGSISSEITSGRWDLLRLTLLPEEYIVDAKYALVQVRSWRWMTVIVSARLAFVIILLLHSFLLPFLVYEQPFDLLLSNFLSPMALYLLTGGTVLIGIFVIEPFWRMHALTALSLAISARIHRAASAFLVAFAAIVIIWITQIVIIGAFFWFTISLSFVAVICSVLIFAVFAFVVWFFYNTLRGRSLRHTTAYLMNLN